MQNKKHILIFFTFLWNVEGQSSQANGAILSCFRIWVIKFELWLKDFPHTRHWWGFSPEKMIKTGSQLLLLVYSGVDTWIPIPWDSSSKFVFGIVVKNIYKFFIRIFLGFRSNFEIGIGIEFEIFWDWDPFFLNLGLGLLSRPLSKLMKSEDRTSGPSEEHGTKS